ncbi:uncharacterized protein LOC116339137 [Contarinia nasturtii]|uniref:uncharacterized protein LOC116339137 n=1 Tax=Contarinia nasturtii TaxID=265458 RepID=UPI0012D37FFC|nr:uncharacterized protein LOC116339137 [Contarinia nasturtii]
MEKVNLLDFPDEILIKIFGYFDKKTLFKAKRVSKRFRNIANEVMPAKYSGKTEQDWYRISEKSSQNDAERYRPFLQSYGTIVSALQISFRLKVSNKKNHWLLSLIKGNLKNVTKLRITGDARKTQLNVKDILLTFPKLTSLRLSDFESINPSWTSRQYPQLESIEIDNVSGIGSLKSFLSNNRQLQHFKSRAVSLRIDDFDMSSLKSLYLADREMIISENSMAIMENLVELSIYSSSKLLFHVISVGCKNIEKFTIHGFGPNIFNDQLNMLSSLKQMKHLKMEGTVIMAHQLKTLIRELPKLITIKARYEGSVTIDDIQLFIGATKNHSSLRSINLTSAKMDDFFIHSLSLNFHEWFNANAKQDLTVILGSIGSSIVITKEKITRRGKLIHWYRGNDHGGDQSGKEFLELNDKCLHKIIGYLDFGGKLVLYQTCHRMQKMIEPIFKQKCSQEDFRIPNDMFLAENFLQHFGRFLPRIHLNASDYSQNTIWNLIHQFCPNHLEELIIEESPYSFIYYLHERGIIFSQLKTLKLKSWKYTYRYLNLNLPDRISGQLFTFCPELVRLEIDDTKAFDGLNMSAFGSGLNHLSVLRFKRCNNTVINFLNCLNDNTCDSLRDLSIREVIAKVDLRSFDDEYHGYGYDDEEEYEEDEENEVIGSINENMLHTITRFTNLTSLHLIVDGLFKVNLKTLFESCPNVKLFSVFYDVNAANMETFKQIKKYGAKIERLQIAMCAEDKDWKYFKFLQNVNQLFPNITVKIIEYFKNFENPANSFILTTESLSNWNFDAQLFG